MAKKTTEEKKAKSAVEKKSEKKEGKIAIILVRGMIGMRRDMKDTARMLKLTRKNRCVIVNSTPSMLGMVLKIKDYATWGPINEETETALLKKYGDKMMNNKGETKERTIFNLNSPRKGFGREGIKQPFSVGGALGDRKEKINDLITRMI